MNVAIVIPAFKESQNIENLIKSILEVLSIYTYPLILITLLCFLPSTRLNHYSLLIYPSLAMLIGSFFSNENKYWTFSNNIQCSSIHCGGYLINNNKIMDNYFSTNILLYDLTGGNRFSLSKINVYSI